MPTTGVSGVVNEFGPSPAPPNGTTESAPGAAAGAAAAERFPIWGEWDVTDAPVVAPPWIRETITVAVARTSTAAATGSPTDRNARELPLRPMSDHSTHATGWHLLRKKRDQFVGTDVIRVMSVPNSPTRSGPPG
jgi:hypothetical protein